MNETTTCQWTISNDYWETACGEAFEFTEGTPIENDFNYCPYCGKPLTEQPDEAETP
jgi:hypothetical protein